MTKVKVKWWNWVILGVVVIISVYLVQACSSIKSGISVGLNDLVGNTFSTLDDKYFVAFKDESQSDYFDGSVHHCEFTLKDGNISLTEDEEIFAFVALSGQRLYDNSLNKIFYVKGSE